MANEPLAKRAISRRADGAGALPGRSWRATRTLGIPSYRDAGKRTLDLVLALTLLMLALPILCGLALVILLTSGAPVLYGTQRVGKHGRVFTIWKLRTMVTDADQVLASWRLDSPGLATQFEKNYKLAVDPRVTMVGRLLRRTSLDELPQLWNVIRGEMSIVGPRPVTAEEVARYGDHRSLLLSVRPGMTGLWQISGRNAMSYDRRMSIELVYCADPRLDQDLRILVRTIPAVLRQRGVLKIDS